MAIKGKTGAWKSREKSQCGFHSVEHRYCTADLPRWAGLWPHFLAIALLLSLSRSNPLSGKSSLIALLLVLGIWTILFEVTKRSRQRSLTIETGPFTDESVITGAHSGHQVTCYGKPLELAAMQLGGEILNEPFVPDVDWSYIEQKWRVVVFCAFVCLLACTGLGGLNVTSLLAILVTYWFAMALSHMRHPIYRISPGLLDVLRKRWIGPATILVHTFDLRCSDVTVRFDKRIAVVNDRCAGRKITIHLNALARPHEFARRLVHAATNPKVAPPLPSDSILG